MYNVSDVFKQFASAPVRSYTVSLDCAHAVGSGYEHYASYDSSNDNSLGGIIGVKIVLGQTTGDFSIGGTVCASLEVTARTDMPFKIGDQIRVQFQFKTPYAMSGASEWLTLGFFYIDSIARNSLNMKITAFDKMIQLAKNFDSALSYPAAASGVLSEISEQVSIALSENIDMPNDAQITEKPVKSTDEDGNDILYTRREVLGYLAGMNGGNAYIDKDRHINFSTPNITGVTIGESSVISQSIAGVTLNISNVVVNTDGTTKSTSDEWQAGTVQLYCPLKTEDGMSGVLSGILTGISYDAVTIKKQGTGYFQLGDMVNFQANGKIYNMLIMGIVYDFSGGFFSETLYSLAKSESQRQYSGVENISQNIATAGTGGGGGGKAADVTSILEENYRIHGMYSDDGFCIFLEASA